MTTRCDEEVFCPISLFRRDGFWIAVGWYDGGNRFISIMCSDKDVAVDVVKCRVKACFPFADSFEFLEPKIEDGDPPYHEKSDDSIWEHSNATAVSKLAYTRWIAE